MASRKDLKRNLNNMVFDIVEECFTIQILDESKTKEADAIIDAAANFQDAMLTKINASKINQHISENSFLIEKNNF